MRKYFPIYEEAVSHIWLCNCSTLNFPIYEENFILFFYQCRVLSFSFFSSRRNWDSPQNPPPAGESVQTVHASPHLWFGGGGALAWGWGVPIPTRGHTLWYSVFISTLCPQPFPPPTSLALDPPFSPLPNSYWLAIPLRPEAEFINIKFYWGFWAQSWEFSDLGFCMDFLTLREGVRFSIRFSSFLLYCEHKLNCRNCKRLRKFAEIEIPRQSCR